MHIIAGEFKHRKLATPKGDQTRPTSGRLRETVFNICQQYTEGAQFLDICAGSGAMGLEALSRGAISATFIENNQPAINAIYENIKNCGIESRCQVLYKDALSALKQLQQEGASFDLCYLDPPYKQTDLLLSIIHFLDQSTLLKEGATLFIEDSANSLINGLVLNKLTLESKRKSGDSILYVFKN
jgi:16S rRNA (guanine966-N2)-methyltransferase